jgi:lipid-A-disaccharide synthase
VRRPRLLIVAGEASGDGHGAGLVAALRARGLEAEVRGVGGPAMAAQGVELLCRYDEIAVVGLTEALGKLPRVLCLLRDLSHRIRREPPDLFVPVDAPDLNLRLARVAAEAGVPVVYFVAPQAWAWREGRVRALRQRVRELLTLFPFEPEWFAARGVATTCVGHPLVDAWEAFRPDPRLRERLGLREGQGLGLLLPGSREAEIRRMLPVMAETARSLRARFPEMRWVVRPAPMADPGRYAPHLEPGFLELAPDSIFELAAAARVVVAASGTASFEAALAASPLVVVYRVSRLTWALARRLVRVPFVSMANLTAGRAVVPEILQDDLTPARLAREVADLLTDAPRAAAMRAELEAVRARFDTRGAYDRAAARVLHHLAPRTAGGA